MNRAARTLRPPPMKLLPRHWPDWRVKGARPARAAICLAVERPEFGQFGHQCARDGWPDAGRGGEQVLLVTPGRRASHGVVDIGVDARQLLFQRLEQACDALA